MHSPHHATFGTSQSILFPKRPRGIFLRTRTLWYLSLNDVLIYQFCRRKCKLKPSTQAASLISCHCSTLSVFSHATLHPLVIVRALSFLRPRITNCVPIPNDSSLRHFCFFLLQKTCTNPFSVVPRIFPFA